MPCERYRPVLCALAPCLTLLALSAPAHAHHTDQEHLTDDTAWTLSGDKMWRLGLFKAAVGLGDRVTVSTYTLPWLTLANGLAIINAQVKWRFYEGDVFHWALQANYARVSFGAFFPDKENPPVAGVVGLSVLSSLRLSSALQLSNGLVFTGVRGRGDFDVDVWGASLQGGVTNIQYVPVLEWRWSRNVALVITGRYLMAQVADVTTTFAARLDDYTTVEGEGDATDQETLNFRRAFSIVPAIAWSWDTFNLVLGLGYGNYNVPGVNFTFPVRTLIPELDLFWTF